MQVLNWNDCIKHNCLSFNLPNITSLTTRFTKKRRLISYQEKFIFIFNAITELIIL